MLNIFAEALMIAARMAPLDRPTRHSSRSQRDVPGSDFLCRSGKRQPQAR